MWRVNTAPDSSQLAKQERLAVLDVPQPLGFLPTRRFWENPENKRLAYGAVFTTLWVSWFAILLIFDALSLSLVWSILFCWLAFMASATIVTGLFERYIRRTAGRRFRSNPKELTGGGGGNNPG
jgi:hypothetical protein